MVGSFCFPRPTTAWPPGRSAASHLARPRGGDTVRPMVRTSQIPLRLFPTSQRTAARERAARVVERLESHRPISAGDGEWQVLYEAADISEAMAMCAADLDDLDPGWEEILDFEAVPSFPRLGARPPRKGS